MTFNVPIGSVRFARYCGKMYSRHLFPFGGLSRLILVFSEVNCDNCKKVAGLFKRNESCSNQEARDSLKKRTVKIGPCVPKAVSVRPL